MSLTLPGSGAVTLPSGSLLAASPSTGDRTGLIVTMQKFPEDITDARAAAREVL